MYIQFKELFEILNKLRIFRELAIECHVKKYMKTVLMDHLLPNYDT